MKQTHRILFVVSFLCFLGWPALFAQNKPVFSLEFSPDKYEIQTLTLNGKSFKVRAYENIVYVSRPVDTNYQKLNIYIPEEYFEGKSINGYTAATAPIFFPNKIGGYMPANAATALPRPGGDFPPGGFAPPDGNKKPDRIPPAGNDGRLPPMGPQAGEKQPSAILLALSRGYVVASAGARGRTTQDKSGNYTGKAPAGIVDLKAAICYLKFNDGRMPGDAGKIISNGTSAGGAMSALLGATGDNPDYKPFLKELGAAEASDAIFAVSAYCPITNLEHADMAYEWQFNGVNTYSRRSFPQPGSNQNNNQATALTEKEIAVSGELKQLFPAYINSLHLTGTDGKPLTLDAQGEGNFKELVKSYVTAAAQQAVQAGADLSGLTWLQISDGKVTGLDFEKYRAYMGRQKTPPAFDALDLSTPENQLFGDTKTDKQHFTDYSATHSLVPATTENPALVKLMNPLNYIAQPQTTTAKYWRIRHGTKDKDTGLAIPVILATCLRNHGFDVNFALPWDKPHSGDYDLDELFQWTDSICD